MPDTFIRGSHITFRAACKDAAGVAFTPSQATLHLSYATPTGRVTSILDMPGAVAIWDSSVALDLPVHWHIRADSVAQDGVFRLVAAEANPSA